MPLFKNLLGLFFWFIAFNSFAWNAMGHQLVAQIAYDNLTPKSKELFDQYNHAFDKYARSNFVASATWLDSLRGRDVHWYDALHYIDIPFSNDATELPSVPEINAQWGINQAVAVLNSSKATDADKGLSLRILIHLVGDIHQPLHTVSQVSAKLPKGDLGGNLFLLPKSSLGNNLHSYWDNGAGYLKGKRKKSLIVNKAHQLEQQWPCSSANKSTKPEEWIDTSHQLALTQVYTLTPDSTPTKAYQSNAQTVVKKQIAYAGCRLANLLNQIADNAV